MESPLRLAAPHPVFRDAALDDLVRRDGFVKLPFLGSDELDRLYGELISLDLFGVTGLYDTGALGLAREVREALHELLVGAFSALTEELLADYEPFISGMLCKWPGSHSQKDIHRDLQVVDEPRFRTVCIWVPLVDTDETNGALSVLPGSHQVEWGPRTVPRSLSVPADPVGGLCFEDLEVVETKRGEAVVFDNALVHGSDENRGTERRIAVALAMAPRRAALSYFFCHGDDRVEQIAVPDPEVFRRLQWDTVPMDLASLGDVPGPPPVMSTIELKERSRDWAARPLRRRTTLNDAGLQAVFEANGFVVVDLLNDEAARKLRSDYECLDHDHAVPMDFADGFHTTLYDRRVEYRREVRRLISSALGAGLARVLQNYEILFANFTVKLPGGETVPEHVDWTFVDEGAASSVTVWCALDSVDENNGALGIVSKSHHRIDFIRAANNRHYDRQAAMVADLPDRDVVPLRCGQAIVLDNRSVHFSPPNLTDHSRVAAAVVAGPAGEPAYHYWFDEDGRMHRLEVTGEFWLSYLPGDVPGHHPGVLSDQVVEGLRWG